MTTSLLSAAGNLLGSRLPRWLAALLLAGICGAEGYTRSEATRVAEKVALRLPSRQAVMPHLPVAGAPDTLVESVDQEWDAAAGGWVDRSRIRYAYTDSRLVRAVSEFFDGGAWMNDSQNVYTYDGQGRLIEDRTERWSGGWSTTTRLQFSHDAAGRVVRTVVQRFVSGTWSNLSQETVAYSAGGDDSLVVRQLWESGAWVNESRVLRALGSGNTLTFTTQNWDLGTGAWVNSQRSVYTYGMNGYLDFILEQKWSESVWTNSARIEYRIQPPGRITEITVREWTDGAWVNSYHAKPTYQAGRQVELVYQVWTDGAWVNEFRTLNVYDVPTALSGGATPCSGIRRLPGSAAGVRFEIPFDAAAFRADVFSARGEWVGRPSVQAAGSKAILTWGAEGGAGLHVLGITAAGKRLSVPFIAE